MITDKRKCADCGTSEDQLTRTLLTRIVRDEKGNPVKDDNGQFIFKHQCRDCHQKEIDEKINSFKPSSYELIANDCIVCPYCGEKHEPDGESSEFYEDGYHEFDCSRCNNKFDVTTNISITYTTSKK